MQERPRTKSNWGAIRVIDDSGRETSSFVLDHLGRLQEKLGRQKNRHLQMRKVCALRPILDITQGVGYACGNNNLSVSINKNIIDKNNSLDFNAKKSLNIKTELKSESVRKENQNDSFFDLPLDFFVQDDYFENGDDLENFFDFDFIINDKNQDVEN